MGLISLDVFKRTTTGKNANRRSRAAGRIPAVVYGHDRTSENIELDQHQFVKIMKKLGGSAAIFQMRQDGQAGQDDPIALLKEVQANPVNDDILHVDLMEIPRGVPVTAPVAVHVVGTNQTVKSGQGLVAVSLTEVEISCRPSQLPDFLEVDISELALNDKLFVRDLTTPVGEIVSDPDALVLNIKAPIASLSDEPAEGDEGDEGAEAAGAEDGDKAEESAQDDA